MNKYFKVLKNEELYEIETGPINLPLSFGSISNVSNLNKELLSDLSWAGYEGIGFWKLSSNNKPQLNFTQSLKAEYNLDIENCLVVASYSVIELNENEIQVKVNNWKNEIRIIRNEYLKSTDFTQLVDAPFTEEEKNQCRIFRQELRDMFNGEVLVNELSWPSIPSALSLEPFPEIPELI